ncbi:MAG: rod shape-determining protein MreD [Myxococcota bacterium]
MGPKLRLAGLALGLLLVQQALTLLLPGWLRPDLLLTMALVLGLRARGLESLVAAFGLGFAIDVLSGAPLGLHALLRGTACAATRAVDRSLFLRAAVPWVLFVLLYAALDSLLGAAVLRVLRPEAALPLAALLPRLPGNSAITAAVSLLVHALARRADPEIDRERPGVPLERARS